MHVLPLWQHRSPTCTVLLQELNPMCPPPFTFTPQPRRQVNSRSILAFLNNRISTSRRDCVNKGSPSAWQIHPVITDQGQKAPMTRRGGFGPRHGQFMTRIGCRASGAPELTSRFGQRSVGRRLPRTRSLSGLIATQSDLKRDTTLNPPITP